MSISQLSRYQDLTHELLKKELRVRYKRLTLGYLWSLGNPLAFAALYYVVFSKILKIQIENYPLVLVAGLFPWQWVSNSVLSSPATFYANAPLIKKTLFPRFLIPLVITLQDGIHFLASLPVLVIFMLMYDVPFTWMMLPNAAALILQQFVILFYVHLLFATLNIFLRDLERILQIVMTFLFYLTPVLYSIDQIPESYRTWFYFHPLAPLILNWKHLFLGQELDLNYFLSTSLYAATFAVFSTWVYRRLSWRFAEVL